MKNLIHTLALSALILGSCTGTKVATFRISTRSETGQTLPNAVDNLSYWNIRGNQFINPERNEEYDVFEFTRYIQFMQCTGGSMERDLFKNPEDRSTVTDYDFSTLIESCRGVISLGAKPHLKLGSVPLKLSNTPLTSEFGTNVRPPADYEQYERYISDVVCALVDEFGMDEVRSWRWGVMTEAENELWFLSENREDTFEDFCRLYATTLSALQAVLGNDIWVGVHSLGQKEGCWEIEDFVRYCAENKLRLCYLSASFYDEAPGVFEPAGLDLPALGTKLRRILDENGYPDAVTGIDEGGILNGTSKGAASLEVLFSRSVGHTWQAGYDARIIKQMFDSGISYFSHWNYLSQGIVSGYPSLSYHVARNSARFEGMQRLDVKGGRPGDAVTKADVEAVAARNDDEILLMAYNFLNDLEYRDSVKVRFELNLPEMAGRDAEVSLSILDDNCNCFDEFWKDREANGWTDEYFHCTPDEHQIMFYDSRMQQEFMKEYAPRYAELSRLHPRKMVSRVSSSGRLKIDVTLGPGAVCFCDVVTAECFSER